MSSNATDALEKLQSSVFTIEDIADKLDDLAYSFLATGNRMAARNLAIMAGKLRQNSETVRQSVGVMTSEYVQAAFQSSVNVLNAALAGAMVGANTADPSHSPGK